jgi:hypothetical protein
VIGQIDRMPDCASSSSRRSGTRGRNSPRFAGIDPQADEATARLVGGFHRRCWRA